jgi:hypothetical protein
MHTVGDVNYRTDRKLYLSVLIAGWGGALFGYAILNRLHSWANP